MNKILVIQLRQLGDVLMTTPLVRQLSVLFPLAKIDFLTEKLGSNVYRYNSHINNLKIIPRKISFLEMYRIVGEIRKEKYDLVIDCFSNPKSAQLAFLTGARERIGFDFRWRRYAYSTVIKLKKRIEYAAIAKLRLIEKFGVNLNDNRIEMPISKEYLEKAEDFTAKLGFDDKTIAFCTVSRRDYKVWKPEYFAKTGDWLISKGYKLWFVYGPGEKELAMQAYSLLSDKSKAIIDYPMPDVLELRAILERCKMYVGNDGGNKHIAICAGIPTVTVFGSIRWQAWTPPDSPNDYAVYKNMDCYDNCKHCKDMRCYKEITEKDLIGTLEKII